MRAAFVLVSVLALVVGACGSDVGPSAVAGSKALSSTDPRGEQIVIQMSVVTAAAEGAEIPATGTVLEGSALGAAPFCVGGTVEDRHPAPDATPARLLDRTITCPTGTVTLGLTPEVGLTPEPPKDRPQKGSWIIVGGTGTLAGVRGSGEMEVTYDPGNQPGKESKARATLTGTVTP